MDSCCAFNYGNCRRVSFVGVHVQSENIFAQGSFMTTLRRYALIMQNVLDLESNEVHDFYVLQGQQEMSDSEMLDFQNEWIYTTDFLKKRFPRFECRGAAQMLIDHEVDEVDAVLEEMKREAQA
jgi:hypothetical protein